MKTLHAPAALLDDGWQSDVVLTVDDDGLITRIAPAAAGGAPDERLRLTWAESDGPPVAAPDHKGFGTRLITEGLAFELDGKATLDYAERGVSCVIDVPLSEPPS